MSRVLSFLVTLFLSAAALADSGHVTNVFVPDGIADARMCIFFQTDTGGAGQWFAIPWNAPGPLAQMQFDKLQAARILGLSLAYTVGGAEGTCSGWPLAYDLRDQ